MIRKNKILILLLLITSLCFLSFDKILNIQDDQILSHIVNLQNQTLRLYWKDSQGNIFKNFKNLKRFTDSNSEKLVFAMNGGMFKKDFSPQGILIENGNLISKIDSTKDGYGNFYLQPNGIFLITNDNIAEICPTNEFINQNIKYATQSGPMLLIDGKMHPKFNKGSKNLNIRNGVGILPNGSVIFAMSKEEINFYDFANYFKNLGCKDALYLDGFVSRTYLPEKEYKSLEGNFGVIIAETKKVQ